MAIEIFIIGILIAAGFLWLVRLKENDFKVKSDQFQVKENELKLEIQDLKTQITDNANAVKSIQSEYENVISQRVETELKQREKQVREESIKKSEDVIKGKVVEQLAFYFEDFPYNPKDIRFVGSPIDFVVFDGLYNGDIKKIVFVEVKNNKSALNKRQSQIKKRLETLPVEFYELKLTI